MEYRFSLSSSRGKKLWISAYKDLGNVHDVEGDLIEINDINVMVELNIIDQDYKINWINKRTKGKDNFIDSLGVEEDKQIIKDALQYAENKGLVDKVLNRCKK